MSWWVMIPPSYQNASDSEKELVDLVVQYPDGSAAEQAVAAGQVVGGKTGLFGQFFLGEGDQQLVKWKGPFATQAEAQAAARPQQQSVNPINDIVNAAQNSGWAGLVLEMERIYAGVTDGKMWRSLGWLLLGVLLMIMGALLMARQSAGEVAAGLARGVA